MKKVKNKKVKSKKRKTPKRADRAVFPVLKNSDRPTPIHCTYESQEMAKYDEATEPDIVPFFAQIVLLFIIIFAIGFILSLHHH